MEKIAVLAGEDAAARGIYCYIAALYKSLAQNEARLKQSVESLDEFLRLP